jgi:hypothetical protein
MTRNTDGLKKSARLRSESAKQRALVALQRMDDSDREINFRTVATQAGVSTAWLYSQEELRGRIMRSRRATIDVPPPASPSQVVDIRKGVHCMIPKSIFTKPNRKE